MKYLYLILKRFRIKVNEIGLKVGLKIGHKISVKDFYFQLKFFNTKFNMSPLLFIVIAIRKINLNMRVNY